MNLKGHSVDEPLDLGFCFNFTLIMGFDLKKGWEIGFREKFGLSKLDIDTFRKDKFPRAG